MVVYLLSRSPWYDQGRGQLVRNAAGELLAYERSEDAEEAARRFESRSCGLFFYEVVQTAQP